MDNSFEWRRQYKSSKLHSTKLYSEALDKVWGEIKLHGKTSTVFYK